MMLKGCLEEKKVTKDCKLNFSGNVQKIGDGQKMIGVGWLEGFKTDLKESLSQSNNWDRVAIIFWLLGPFLLLIERSPADLWLSLLALAFLVRSIFTRNFQWMGIFWVQATLFFWLVSLLAAALSTMPGYSLGETVAWIRFPLFAAACAFWLSGNPKLSNLFLLSSGTALLMICIILTAEILIIGPQNGRLSWPYGDLMPGNFIAKASLPAFIIASALSLCLSGRRSFALGLLSAYALFSCLMTGERVNFLIILCSGTLAILLVGQSLKKIYVILAGLAGIVGAGFLSNPYVLYRFHEKLFSDLAFGPQSDYFRLMGGGLKIFSDNVLFGIGPGNYRFLSHDLLADSQMFRPDNHPHNFYIQLLAETGLMGLLAGLILIFAIFYKVASISKNSDDKPISRILFIVPLAFFWPVAATADFFGQWNNVFMWTSLGFCLAYAQQRKPL